MVVKAWAVVCADGCWREPSTWSSRAEAIEEREFLNKEAKERGDYCGGSPHTVVPLTGSLKLPAKARGKGKGK